MLRFRNAIKFFGENYISVRNSSEIKIVTVIDQNKIGINATIKGWVTAIRKLKETTFIDVNDGSCHRMLQLVILRKKVPAELTYGSSIEANGIINLNQNQQYELAASEIKVIGNCPLNKEYPLAPRKRYDSEEMRQYLHLRPKAPIFGALLRVRNCLSYSIHNFFRNNDFIFIHTPIITSNDCEGAGEIFTVAPDSEKLLDEMKKSVVCAEKSEIFFNKKAFMSVSGQLNLEAVVRGLGQVYNFGPVFRAENSKSRLHLSEFYMVEAEKAFIESLEDLTFLCENFVRTLTLDVINECSEDVNICRKNDDSSSLNSYERLESLVVKPFTKMTYTEAYSILNKNSEKLQTTLVYGSSFSKEQELFLVKHNGNCPMFIMEWPKACKPFYMKTSQQQSDVVMAFDLLCPNVGEVCGGSLREDDISTLTKSLEKDNLQEKLLWYIQLRKFGNVPTGGFGLGFERYIQVLLHIFNIKDTIPFPRWPHNCSL